MSWNKLRLPALNAGDSKIGKEVINSSTTKCLLSRISRSSLFRKFKVHGSYSAGGNRPVRIVEVQLQQTQRSAVKVQECRTKPQLAVAHLVSQCMGSEGQSLFEFETNFRAYGYLKNTRELNCLSHLILKNTISESGISSGDLNLSNQTLKSK